MVGKNEETVVSDEKTVSFLNAIEHLKEHDGIAYGVIEDKIGLKKNTISMIKVGRRKVKGFEIENLINSYSETSIFFNEQQTSPIVQTNEPMEEYFNGGVTQKLIKRQEEMIELLKSEVERLKSEVGVLKSENAKLVETNKVLSEIVTKINQK